MLNMCVHVRCITISAHEALEDARQVKELNWKPVFALNILNAPDKCPLGFNE